LQYGKYGISRRRKFMKKFVFSILITLILLLGSTSASPSENKLKTVNLMIDMDMLASPTKEQVFAAESNLLNMRNEMEKRDLKATFFSTYDVITTRIRLRLTEIGRSPNFELALSGNNSNEKISTKSYAEQKSILERSKKAVENCRVCGKNEIVASGFMPQSFDQNNDTYRILDELGIQYDAGFQAGVIYAPGHPDDAWPYQVEGHNFYAVPVSTYSLSDKKVPLQDRYFKENGLTSSQWYDALVGKFSEAQNNNEPVVIALTTSISGSGDYLDALKQFLDLAISNDASFVTTMDLVNMSRKEGYQPPAPASKVCTTCGQDDEKSIEIGVAVASNNTTDVATIDSASITKN
jgi:hypothetical protein